MKKYLPEENYKKIIVCCLYAIILAVAAFVTFRFLLPLALPFLLAWMFASMLAPLIRKLQKKTRLPAAFWSIVILLVAVAVLGLAVFLIYRLVADQISNLAENYMNEPDRLHNMWGELVASLSERFPIVQQISENRIISSLVSDGILDFASRVASDIPTTITRFLGRMPAVLVFVGVFIISNFYFNINYFTINDWIYSKFSREKGEKISNGRKTFAGAVRKYLRAVVIMFSITYAQLLIGFLIFGINSPIVLAFIISIIDMLPVFGVGTVLVPWIIILFVLGNYYIAVGLTILFVVITVVRQVLEPKIMGRNMGVHPLFALAAIYSGFKLMGVAGIILGPLTAFVISAFVREYRATKKRVQST
ncbi:MAG: sporulation integral membrane protein YtvI [Oscillospiraceae bacterium]|nr:sporulation integral membrane protein YtvI [Oscillospiraceae bacterium]